MMTLSPAIPILRIFSVDKAKEFYLDFLGFTLAWEHRFSEDLPLYMQVTRTGLTLHLGEHYGLRSAMLVVLALVLVAAVVAKAVAKPDLKNTTVMENS